MRVHIWGSALLLLAAIVPAQADGIRKVQDLYNDCKSDAPADNISCLRYLSGVAGMLQVGGFIVTGTNNQVPEEDKRYLIPLSVCDVEMVSPGQMQQAFLDWADKNTTKWQLPESYGAWSSLQGAWPCHLNR